MLDGFDLEVFEGKVYSSGVRVCSWWWLIAGVGISPGRQCCQLGVVIPWVTQPLVTAGEEVKQPAP